tara:strand:+ start:1817 stop:1981 length:165 start_codon:yes stop_codon:yes gene_type:complete
MKSRHCATFNAGENIQIIDLLRSHVLKIDAAIEGWCCGLRKTFDLQINPWFLGQ